MEDRIPSAVRDALAARGHKIEMKQAWSEGHVLAVQVDRKRGLVFAGADPRGQLGPVMAAQAIGW